VTFDDAAALTPEATAPDPGRLRAVQRYSITYGTAATMKPTPTGRWWLVDDVLAALTPEATAPEPGLSEAWAEAEGVVFWDWTLRLTRLVQGGYRAEAIAGDEVKVYTVASDPDAALRELSDVITESHVND